jgi:hypothetical protein
MRRLTSQLFISVQGGGVESQLLTWPGRSRFALCRSTLSRATNERPGGPDPQLIRVRRIQPVGLLGVRQRPLGQLHEIIVGHSAVVVTLTDKNVPPLVDHCGKHSFAQPLNLDPWSLQEYGLDHGAGGVA